MRALLLALFVLGGCGQSDCPQACGAGLVCINQRCAAPSDPCQGITQNGICPTGTQVQFCALGSDGATPELVSFDCQTGEQCQQNGGVATCVLTAACREGNQQCTSSGIQICQNGAWVASTCPRACITSPIGDFCGIDEDTQTLTGTFQYELRGPNADKSDWDAPGPVTGAGFLIASTRGSGDAMQYIDIKTTSEDLNAPGTFSVQIAQTPQPGDLIIVYAIGARPDGTLSFVVADPGLTASTTPQKAGMPGSAAQLWAWGFDVQTLSSPATITAHVADFSGAARVFDYLNYVFLTSAARWPKAATPGPLVVWLGQGVDWTCGSCQVPTPTYIFGQQFRSQIFIPGGTDERYWSDSLVAHELGHWAMQSYGRAVGESGAHCVGLPTAPGLAWSEGYATWFSADARIDPVYVDKQNGTMFWFDLSTRTSSSSSWLRPSVANGLTQEINENEIAAMLWDLSATQGLGEAPLDTALTSPRMTAPPFERGYHREVWSLAGDCSRGGIEDTQQSTTSFADFLDALACDNTPATAIDTATQPSSNFPYPSQQPLCRSK